MHKLKKVVFRYWLNVVKLIVVFAIIGAMWPMLQTTISFFENRGKTVGKVEFASIPSIDYGMGSAWLKNADMEFRPDAVYPNPEYHPYQFPARDVNEFVRYKSNILRTGEILSKLEMERLYEEYGESMMWLDVRQKKEQLDALLASYTASAEQRFGTEAVSQAWSQNLAKNSAEIYISPRHLEQGYGSLFYSLQMPFLFWIGFSVFIVMLYNIGKLKQRGMRIWCEFANLRLLRVSASFFFTLVVDSYPVHGVAEQLRTVRNACATVLSLFIAFGAATVASAQSSGGNGSSSTKQKTDYALVIESRPSVALNGDDPKPETAIRVMFTTPNGIFLEDVASYRKSRLTNSFVVGKWFDVHWASKFGKLRVGPYGGWRYTDAPNVPREDSVVSGAKISFTKSLDKNGKRSLNVVAPTLQVERSFQKKTFTFANVAQVFGSWKKQGINFGVEYLYRKTQGKGFTGYIGPIFAKKLVTGKNFLKSLYGEIGLFKEIPIGDLRFRVRLTLQL